MARRPGRSRSSAHPCRSWSRTVRRPRALWAKKFPRAAGTLGPTAGSRFRQASTPKKHRPARTTPATFRRPRENRRPALLPERIDGRRSPALQAGRQKGCAGSCEPPRTSDADQLAPTDTRPLPVRPGAKRTWRALHGLAGQRGGPGWRRRGDRGRSRGRRQGRVQGRADQAALYQVGAGDRAGRNVDEARLAVGPSGLPLTTGGRSFRPPSRRWHRR